jgi:hypothetical protein
MRRKYLVKKANGMTKDSRQVLVPRIRLDKVVNRLAGITAQQPWNVIRFPWLWLLVHPWVEISGDWSTAMGDW